MLVTVKNKLNQEKIEYINENFHNDYIKYNHGDLKFIVFNKIALTFFRKISAEILKGFNFGSPIGAFYIKKIFNNPNVKYISYAATNKARRETGDDNIVIYRDNPYHFKMLFMPDIIKNPDLKNYFFKISWQNNRDTGKNFETLRLNVV